MIKSFKNNIDKTMNLSWEEKNPTIYVYQHSEDLAKLVEKTNELKRSLQNIEDI